MKTNAVSGVINSRPWMFAIRKKIGLLLAPVASLVKRITRKGRPS
jgi:hypothetical protein